MQNPFENLAGMSGMNDPLGFVKKLWGDMQLPGMVTPTLSVDDLDKQIKDLKTVETWLNVNMNMLRGSIQALEVQRATIAALKTMGESFAQASMPKPANTASTASTAQAPKPSHATDTASPEPESTIEEQSASPNPAAWWTLLQDQFKQALGSAMAEPIKVKPEAESKPAKAAARPVPKTKPAAKPVAKSVVKKTATGPTKAASRKAL
ncbi:MAG: hypothetical protein K2P84_07655 [Undibacterium sp.]|nr:hypothetical protein [Undibacterium sp.]